MGGVVMAGVTDAQRAIFQAVLRPALHGEPVPEYDPGDLGALAAVVAEVVVAGQAGGAAGAQRAWAAACRADPNLHKLLSSDEEAACPVAARFVRMGASAKPPFVDAAGKVDLGLIKTGDLLSQDFPRPGWIVDDLIPEGELSFLVSDGGIGKSWLLLTLSETLAGGGRTFLGQHCEPCNVVYLDMELDRAWYSNRVAMVDAGLRKQSIIQQRGGEREVYYLEAPNIVLDGALAFLDRVPPLPGEGPPIPTAFDYLRAVIVQTGARLLIIDPIAELWGATDENSAPETATVCKALRAVARETGAAILVAHHTNKGRVEERGSTAIRNAAAAMFTMTWHNSDGDGGQRLRKLETNKSRHGRDLEPLFLDFQWEDGALAVEVHSAQAVAALREDQAEAERVRERDLVVGLVSSKPAGHYNKSRLAQALREEEGLSARGAEAAIKAAVAEELVITTEGARNAKLYQIP